VVLGMRLHCVCSHHAEVITTSLQRGKEICVLLLVRMNNCAISQDDFIVLHIVGCPAVLGAQETHST
jgi:hypothetical protein